MSYGADISEMFHGVGVYTGKVLQGDDLLDRSPLPGTPSGQCPGSAPTSNSTFFSVVRCPRRENWTDWLEGPIDEVGASSRTSFPAQAWNGSPATGRSALRGALRPAAPHRWSCGPRRCCPWPLP
jgi:hypothetical protein